MKFLIMAMSDDTVAEIKCFCPLSITTNSPVKCHLLFQAPCHQSELKVNMLFSTIMPMPHFDLRNGRGNSIESLPISLLVDGNHIVSVSRCFKPRPFFTIPCKKLVKFYYFYFFQIHFITGYTGSALSFFCLLPLQFQVYIILGADSNISYSNLIVPRINILMCK